MRSRHLSGLTSGGGRDRTATFDKILFTLAALLLAPAVHASSFQVSPVVLEVPAGGRNAVLTLRNNEQTPVSVQVRLYRWTQHDGADVYEPTDELIASPPIMTVPAGGTQLLRIGPRTGRPSGAYRVIIEDILPPATKASQVRIALRLNLPLYVMPAPGAKAALRWSGSRDATGNITLRADNDGARYDTVVAIGAIDAAHKTIRLSSHFGAVLPGGSKRWSIGKHPKLGLDAPLDLSVTSGDGVVTRAMITLVRR